MLYHLSYLGSPGWGKEETLTGEPADGEGGKLAPQNNQFIWIWMPGSLTDWRKRSNEELKSKGRIEREMQWGNKVEGSSVLQNISLQKGCINLFYLQVGMDKLSLQELNKGTLVYSQAEGQGPPSKPLSMIIIIKWSKKSSFQHGVRIVFLPATPLLNLSKKGNGLNCFVQKESLLIHQFEDISLVAQWLRLYSQCRGPGSNPTSGNQIPPPWCNWRSLVPQLRPRANK